MIFAKVFTVGLLFTACGVAVSAAPIATYDFDNSSDAATTSDANLDAGAVTFGAGLFFSGISDTQLEPAPGAPNNLPNDMFDGDGSGDGVVQVVYQANGIDKTSEKYIQLVLTPDAGYTLDLSSISFTAGSTSGGTGRVVDVGYVVGTDPIVLLGPTQAAQTTAATLSYDLSGIATTTESVTLRIFGDSQSDATIDRMHGFDDIEIEGAVALVPEPASLALLGLGGLAMFGRRNRD